MEAVGKKLTGKLRFASEAVDDPGLRGTPLPPQGYYFGEGSDDVEQKWFAEAFAQLEVKVEKARLVAEDFGAGEVRVGCGAGLLPRDLYERIEAAFTDGANLRFGGKCPQEAQGGGGDAPVVPGMDADGVEKAGTKGDSGDLTGGQIDGIEVYKGVAVLAVGVDVEGDGAFEGGSFHGTGS